MQLRICCCAMAACLVLTVWCYADENDVDKEKEPTTSLGAGAVINSKPYVGADARVYPIPLFRFEGKRFYLRGASGGYRLFTGEGWSLGPVVQPRLDGYEEDDSSALEGMDDRDWSVDAGAAFSWRTGIGLFELAYITDLLGRHDGQEADFRYALRFRRGAFTFVPATGIRWKSENLVDYYYGVQSDEVRPDRPSYEGGDALNPYVGVTVQYKLGERWRLLTGARYEWLDDEIADSPIVDDHYEVSFLAGILYSW